MMQAEDLYRVLMVDRSVDSDILEAVYRRLVARYHPGAGGGAWAAGRLAAVERAYVILRDPHLRARYDARTMGQEEHGPATAPAAPAAPAPSAAPLSQPTMVQVVSQRRPVATQGVKVLDFGRYAGWSLRQLAAHDPDYLEWLGRSPGGRQHHKEIAALLGSR